MKPPSPRDVQTDALGHNKHQNASEQTVIIGEGSAGGAQNSLAGAALTPTPPRQAAPAAAPAAPAPAAPAASPAPAVAASPAAAAQPPRRETPQQQTVLMTDNGHTKLLPYPGAAVSADPVKASPVVGWLVVVEGPGKGNFRPIYPGSNTIGRSSSQRIPIDFGDEAISSEKHAFMVYDGRKKQFQVVPNLEKSNLVHLNDSALLANSEIKGNDRISIGQTTLLFVPLCGPDFDWGDMK